MFLKHIIHRIVLYNIGLQLLLSIPIGHTETINALVVNNANEIVNFSEADVLSSQPISFQKEQPIDPPIESLSDEDNYQVEAIIDKEKYPQAESEMPFIEETIPEQLDGIVEEIEKSEVIFDDSVETSSEAAVSSAETTVQSWEAFCQAASDPAIARIHLGTNIIHTTAASLAMFDRAVTIVGHGYQLNTGPDRFELGTVEHASTLRLENIVLGSANAHDALVYATPDVSAQWSVEMENIQELSDNQSGIITLAHGKVIFTGGTNTLDQRNDRTLFQVKDFEVRGQSLLNIERGDATILFASADSVSPTMMIHEGAEVSIVTANGNANTIDLRGNDGQVQIADGASLKIQTGGTTIVPTETANNALIMSGTHPTLTVSNQSLLQVDVLANAKRAVYLNGRNPEITIDQSTYTTSSVSNSNTLLAGDNPVLALRNASASLRSTSGDTLTLSGTAPQLKIEQTELSVISTTGRRIGLIGDLAVLQLQDAQSVTLEGTSGQGILVQGMQPEMRMTKSILQVNDEGASNAVTLDGADALLLLEEESLFEIKSEGTGTNQNMIIGNNHPRPKLRITKNSMIDVNTASSQANANILSNNVLNVRGDFPVIELSEDSELNMTVNSGRRRGIYFSGREALFHVDNSHLTLLINQATGIYMEGIRAEAEIKNYADIYINNGVYFRGNYFSVTDKATFVVDANTNFVVNTSNDAGVFTFQRSAGEESIFLIDNATVNILEATGTQIGGLSMMEDNSTIKVQNSASLKIKANGSSSANAFANFGIRFFTASTNTKDNNNLFIKDQASVEIEAPFGPAVTMANNHLIRHYGQIVVENLASFKAIASPVTAGSGVVYAGGVDFHVNNPLYIELTNNNGQNPVFHFSFADGSTVFSGINSPLTLWRIRDDHQADPWLEIEKVDFAFSSTTNSVSGLTMNLTYTSDEEKLNSSLVGSLGNYSRIVIDNTDWGIADELYVPTDADKKIYGHLSVPNGLNSTRSARDNEVEVEVEVKRITGETETHVAKSVGHTEGSPGISIYGEEPRGGLFEINLKQYLQAGDTVRITRVELTSGALTEGYDHQILTDTVETFPIVPPIPAEFTSAFILIHSQTLEGVSENKDVAVLATINGEWLDTKDVEIDPDGRFTIDLSHLSLAEDDEIQVFLQDNNGSAQEANVSNPPATNNKQGNINPATQLTFRDTTFPAAPIIKVVGPVLPVDPLDPDATVDPENKPDLEEQGILSIDFVSQFQFGTQRISINDTVYYAQPQRLLNEAGDIIDTQSRPNYIQISDRRPESKTNSWQLSVTQKKQFADENKQELNGARLALTNQQLIKRNAADSLRHLDPITIVPGAKQLLIAKTGTEGHGTWIYRFGDQDSASTSVHLEVPKGANPKATNYSSTLTWELSAVPLND